MTYAKNYIILMEKKKKKRSKQLEGHACKSQHTKDDNSSQIVMQI